MRRREGPGKRLRRIRPGRMQFVLNSESRPCGACRTWSSYTILLNRWLCRAKPEETHAVGRVDDGKGETGEQPEWRRALVRRTCVKPLAGFAAPFSLPLLAADPPHFLTNNPTACSLLVLATHAPPSPFYHKLALFSPAPFSPRRRTGRVPTPLLSRACFSLVCTLR